jgi:D-amino peptidase
LKVFIMTDLEGPAGVNRWVATREGETPEKREAMKLLTAEVNAAIQGILHEAPGAEFVVLDGHGEGGLIFSEIHGRAQTIMRGEGMKPPYGLDPVFDGVYFVGQHAMAGTENAPLCHTYSSRHIEYYKLNGKLIGEIGCFAAIAGSLKVPTVFISGDDKACEEARAIIPDIVTCPTKVGMGIELALHYSPEQSQSFIRFCSGQAVRRLREIKPYVIDPPYELEIRVLEGCSIEGYLRSGAEKIDDRTVVRRSRELLDLFR